MWSQKTRYALRAMIHLSLQGDRRVPAGDISRRCGVPRKYLETIMADLRRGGLVESSRGKTGGYRARKDPSTIVLADILELMEPELLRISPWEPEGGAEEPFLERFQRAFIEKARGATLAEAILQWQTLRNASDYSI